jgi:bacterioferritin
MANQKNVGTGGDQAKDNAAGSPAHGSAMSSKAELRRRARETMECGPVTPDYGVDLDEAVRLLNEALATEVVCTLRYRHHYYMAQGIHSASVREEFLEHAQEEQEHADRIAERIRQLGGNPDLNPTTLLARSHAEYQEGRTLVEMIRQDLYAERIAIESYREMVRFFGEGDPTSRRLMESILEKEEEHADDLADLLQTLDPTREHAGVERTMSGSTHAA